MDENDVFEQSPAFLTASSSDCSSEEFSACNVSFCALKTKVKRKSNSDQLPLTGKKQCQQTNLCLSDSSLPQSDDSSSSSFVSPSRVDGSLSSSLQSTNHGDENFLNNSHSDLIASWLGTFESFSDIDKISALTSLVKQCNLNHVRHIRRTIEPLFQKDFISQLPEELALYVLSFLSPRDLISAAATCRHWRILSEDNALWRLKCRQAKISSLPPLPPFPCYSNNDVAGDDDDRPCYTSTSLALLPRKPTSTLLTPEDVEKTKNVYLRYRKITSKWRNGPALREIVLRSHDDHVITCLQINGDKIVSGSDDNTLKVWSMTTGECLLTLSGHSGGVWCSQLTEGGDLLCSGSTDRTVRVWDLATGQCVHILNGHMSTVRCMALKNDTLVSGSRDTTLRAWNIITGDCLHCLTGHVAAVRCVQYDGRRAVSGAYDYTVKVWDVETETCLHTLAGHTNRVYSLKLDSERNIVVSGSLDTSIRVWDIVNGQSLLTLVGHQSLTSGMELRDNILVSGNADSTLKVWDITNGQCLYTLAGKYQHKSAVTSLQFLENGLVATSSDDGTVKLWDTRTGEYIRDIVRLPSGGSGGCIWRLKATATTLVCAVGSRNGTEETKLLVFDFNAGYP